MIKADYLVIGSGIAGLTFSVKIAEKFPERNVVIVTKASEKNLILNMLKVVWLLF